MPSPEIHTIQILSGYFHIHFCDNLLIALYLLIGISMQLYYHFKIKGEDVLIIFKLLDYSENN
jgi:hypothetical protein